MAHVRIDGRRQPQAREEADDDGRDPSEELDDGLDDLAYARPRELCDVDRGAHAQRHGDEERDQRHFERAHEERQDVELWRLAHGLPDRRAREHRAQRHLFVDLLAHEDWERLTAHEDEYEEDRRDRDERDGADGSLDDALEVSRPGRERRASGAIARAAPAFRTHAMRPESILSARAPQALYSDIDDTAAT